MPQPFDMFHSRDNFERVPTAATMFLKQPDPVASFAFELLKSPSALIQGADDGEDSAGRQKARPLSTQELVTRAFDVSQAAYAEAEKRDLMIDIPKFSEIDDFAKARSDKN